MKRRALLLTLALVLLVATAAWARLGGGESFGGGSGGGGGGGDVGDAIDLIIMIIQIIWFLVDLCIHYPHIGFPLVGVIIVMLVILYFKGRRMARFVPPAQTHAHVRRPERAAAQNALPALRSTDPNFSEIIFLDFVQLIYARYQEARGATGSVESLSPYLEPALLERLAQQRQPNRVVEGVIVGSSNLAQVKQVADGWQITVDMETNYTERGADEQKGKAWYTRTRLEFQRKAGAKSLGPDSTKALGCPSCGSPVKVDQSGECAYCGKVVKPGEFTWQLIALVETTKMPRERLSLNVGGQEVGTDRPTVYDPNLEAERKAFALAYPDFNWDKFRGRVQEVFFALQKAWTEKSWEVARPYETDRLFQTHLFWIERYRTHNYTNVLEDIKLEKMEVVKVERDPYFDLITVRLYASMIDYTTDKDGKVIGGNKHRARKFTEYWTFLRKAGFAPKPAAPGAEEHHGDQCPSCGAPLKVSMSGVCDYCGSNITGGDFDWTLAKIEQDEVYAG